MLLAARAMKAAQRLDLADRQRRTAYRRFLEDRHRHRAARQPDRRSPTPAHDPLQAVVTTVAAPAQPLPAGGDGFTIERTYYKLDGNEANVTEATQNERYVVVLKINAAQRLALARAGQRPVAGRLRDRQSAPGRQRRADATSPGWRRPRPRISNSATTVSSRPSTAIRATRRTFTLAYVVRAVTPGTYAHPAASVEDMYRPRIFGPHRDRHDGGQGALRRLRQ